MPESKAKRVQDCFVEWAGWEGHRSSLLQGLVDSFLCIILLERDPKPWGEIGLDERMALVEARKRKKGSLGERKEGKGCSDESSARTYGDGARGLRIPFLVGMGHASFRRQLRQVAS